jgi:hypothetical protein
MDGEAFEALSKQVAAGSRRGALRVLLGGVAGAAVGGQAAQEEAGAIFGFCSPPGTPCSRNKKCCAGSCKKGVCGCRKQGKPCMFGLNCCSQRCHKGKCR